MCTKLTVGSSKVDVVEVLAYPGNTFRISYRKDQVRHFFGLQSEVVDATVRMKNKIGFRDGSRHAR